MQKTLVKDFGIATLKYYQGDHNFFVLETKPIAGISHSRTHHQYFPVKPTKRQVRKSLQDVARNTVVRI